MNTRIVAQERRSRGIKWCCNCKAEHRLEDFGFDKTKADGRNACCRKSINEKQNQRLWEKGRKKRIPGKQPEPSMAEIEKRFWSLVEKSSGDSCWIWRGVRTSGKGYARFRVAGKYRPASVMAWELTHKQKAPSGLYGLHHCDNPSCVRPDHIFLGTYRDNWHDALEKGRARIVEHKRGSEHWNWKGGISLGL